MEMMVNQPEAQLAFGESDQRAGATGKVGTNLGYGEIGLGGWVESHLPGLFQELTMSGQMEFKALAPGLIKEATKLYEKEIALINSGLPKAPDAEDYFAASYGVRQDGTVKEINQQEAINLFAGKNTEKLVFVQKAFKRPEEIEAVMGDVEKTLRQVEAKISKIISASPIFKYQYLPQVPKGGLLPLDALDKRTVQRLGILDLHRRNLRDIARTFYMYQMMTKGCVWPTDLKTAAGRIEDNPDKERMRGQAERVSAEIYGDLDENLWRETLYKYLESYRGNPAVDDRINDLERRLLGDMSEAEQETAAREIALLKMDKERERTDSVKTRVARFALAAVELGQQDSLATLEQRQALRQRYSGLVKECDLDGGSLQKKADSYIESRFAACEGVEQIAGILEVHLGDLANHLKAANNPEANKIRLLQQNLGLGASKIKLQDLIDIVSVTEADLEEYLPEESLVGKTETLEIAKHGSRNSLEWAEFIQNMLGDMGIAAEIAIEGKEAKAEPGDERKFKIRLTKAGSIGVSTTDFRINLPIARIFSPERMAELFGHELMAHIGGAERVLPIAPGLINTFHSNGANEGCANVLETVMAEVIEDPELAKMNLAAEGELDKIFRRIKARDYKLPADKLTLPVESGNLYIMALGLHLGFGKAIEAQGQRRNLQEVFDLMKELKLVEYLYEGWDPAKANQQAEKDAFVVGVFRQARGLWDKVTYKNMSYVVGGLVVKEMLKRNDDLSRLIAGKVGPEHAVYQELFGLNATNIDARWGFIDRKMLLKNLGLGEMA